MLSTTQKHETDYRWLVLAAATVAMVFTFGTPLSYGIFLTPFSEEFGLSEVQLSFVFSIQLFAFYVGSGAVSVYATRLPTRKVFAVAAVLTGILAPSIFLIDSFASLFVVFVLLGGAIGTVFILLISIVPQWFEEYRGIATGILLSGNGFSLFALPPIWQYGFEHFGVRKSFFTVILFTAISFFLVAAVGKRAPWVDRSGATASELGNWISMLLSSRKFQYLLVGKGMSFAWYYLLAAYALNLFTTRGMSTGAAAVAFGLIGGISIVSRLGIGFLADRFGFLRMYYLSVGCTIFGGLLLLLPGIISVYIAVGLFGIGLGGIATLHIPILLRVYDPTMSTAVMGTFNLGTGTAGLLAPPVAIAVISYQGSFTGVVLLTITASCGAILGFWLGLQKDEQDENPAASLEETT